MARIVVIGIQDFEKIIVEKEYREKNRSDFIMDLQENRFANMDLRLKGKKC